MKHALGHVWALVAKSRERLLTEDERKELSRLCSNLEGFRVMNQTVKADVDFISMRINSSGLLESGRVILNHDAVLDEIDRLRERL